MPKGFGRPNVSIFVRNLPYEVTSRELQEVFEKYGQLRDVYIPLDFHTKEPRGFAYIQFGDIKNSESAVRATDGIHIRGRPIEVCFAEGDRKKPGQMMKKDKSPLRRVSPVRRRASRSPLRRRGSPSRRRSPHPSPDRRRTVQRKPSPSVRRITHSPKRIAVTHTRRHRSSTSPQPRSLPRRHRSPPVRSHPSSPRGSRDVDMRRAKSPLMPKPTYGASRENTKRHVALRRSPGSHASSSSRHRTYRHGEDMKSRSVTPPRRRHRADGEHSVNGVSRLQECPRHRTGDQATERRRHSPARKRTLRRSPGRSRDRSRPIRSASRNEEREARIKKPLLPLPDCAEARTSPDLDDNVDDDFEAVDEEEFEYQDLDDIDMEFELDDIPTRTITT